MSGGSLGPAARTRALPWEAFIALRYLRGSRRTLGGALTSIIAMAGVTVGVAALVATLAVMTGFREDIRAKILGAQPHLLIEPPGELTLPETLAPGRMEGLPDVLAHGPYVLGQALARSQRATQGVVVKAVDPALEPAVTGLEGRVVAGDWAALSASGSTRPAVLLGRELARRLSVRVGDPVVLAVSGGGDPVLGAMPFFHSLTVGGELETGLYDYDSSLAVVSLKTGQALFGLRGRVTAWGVRLKNPDAYTPTAMELQRRFASQAVVRSWLGMNRSLFAALQLEKVVMFLILTLITLVAAFTILSNLLLVTTQRVREIGILRAMGATRGAIQRLFLLKGLTLGAVGTAVGTSLGLAIAGLLKRYEFVKLPPDVYYVQRLPVRVVPLDVLMVAAAALVIVLLATLYPARAAARLDALEAIRRV